MPQSTKEARAKRYSIVADLYLKGWYQSDIAAKVGVTQQQISNDLKVIYRLWKQSAIQDFNTLKERELIKIDNMERTYWEAWQKSIQKYTKETKRFIKDKLSESKIEEIFQYPSTINKRII